jgi:glycosyltransferase involved in cell wall biosynthesis
MSSPLFPTTPQVSVVIPTCDRPTLLQRAIASALAQTLTEIEVIVVINGADQNTEAAIVDCGADWVDDSRLRILRIAEAGASHARNAGVNAAIAPWVALLDDDDCWMPTKLAQQLAMAEASTATWPIIATQLIARTPKGDFLRPRRLPRSDEAISDYLLTRRSFFQGEGLIQTSVIFTKRELLLTVPFQQIPKHQDWDWFLRVVEQPGVAVEFVPEALSVWYLEEARASVSAQMNWRNSLTWIRANRDRVTRSAYASFLLVEVGSQAARNRDWQQFWPLLREAMTLGKPLPIGFLLYLVMWLMPMELRRSLRSRLSRKAVASSV